MSRESYISGVRRHRTRGANNPHTWHQPPKLRKRPATRKRTVLAPEAEDARSEVTAALMTVRASDKPVSLAKVSLREPDWGGT